MIQVIHDYYVTAGLHNADEGLQKGRRRSALVVTLQRTKISRKFCVERALRTHLDALSVGERVTVLARADMIARLANVVVAVDVAEHLAVDAVHAVAVGLCHEEGRSAWGQSFDRWSELAHSIETVVLEAVTVAVRAPACGFDVAGHVFHDLDNSVDCKYGRCDEGEDGGESKSELHDEAQVELYWIELGG